MLYYIIFCYIILYYIMLYYIIWYYIILNYIILNYIILYYIILNYIIYIYIYGFHRCPYVIYTYILYIYTPWVTISKFWTLLFPLLWSLWYTSSPFTNLLPFLSIHSCLCHRTLPPPGSLSHQCPSGCLCQATGTISSPCQGHQSTSNPSTKVVGPMSCHQPTWTPLSQSINGMHSAIVICGNQPHSQKLDPEKLQHHNMIRGS